MGAMKQLAIEDTEYIMGMLKFDQHVEELNEDDLTFFGNVEESLFVRSRSTAEGLMRVGWEYASTDAKERFINAIVREMPYDSMVRYLGIMLDGRRKAIEEAK